MAILLNGISGGISGKVGTVTGYMWKGKAVIRSLPKKRTGTLSEAQLKQQAKFALINEFLNPAIMLVKKTFHTVAVQMSGYNKAFSYDVKNAITGVYPDLTINYPMVLVGRGDLPNVQSPAVYYKSGQLVFTWKDNSGLGQALATDRAYVAMYKEREKYLLTKMDLEPRSAESFTLDARDMDDQRVHVYLGFIAADEKEVSDSVYLGALEINLSDTLQPDADEVEKSSI